MSLRDTPELALLTALSSTLRSTIELLTALHPELGDQSADPTIEVAAAEAVVLASAGLLAAVQRYRDLFDDDLF